MRHPQQPVCSLTYSRLQCLSDQHRNASVISVLSPTLTPAGSLPCFSVSELVLGSLGFTLWPPPSPPPHTPTHQQVPGLSLDPGIGTEEGPRKEYGMQWNIRPPTKLRGDVNALLLQKGKLRPKEDRTGRSGFQALSPQPIRCLTKERRRGGLWWRTA